MPVITFHSVVAEGGTGVEFADRKGIITKFEGVVIPRKIGLDFFNTNRSLIPLFRYAARHTLLVTEKPDVTSHADALKVVKELYKSPITQVEKVQAQPTDGGKTTNYVIPLITDKGTIEIVVNGAWGVSWRLNKDHELVKSHPTLASCQPEDKGVGTGEGADKYYLSPEVLEQATLDEIEPAKLADRIHKFVSELISKSKKVDGTYTPSMRGLPYNYAGEADVMTFGPEILPDGGNIFARLKFDLGYKHGVKSITIDGSGGNDDKKALSAFGTEAKDIGELISQFFPKRSTLKTVV